VVKFSVEMNWGLRLCECNGLVYETGVHMVFYDGNSFSLDITCM
jgi:hypothetical protein